MIKELEKQIRTICEQLFDEQVDPQLQRPEGQFGDFTTNVGFRLAGKLGKKPAWIAEEISSKLSANENIKEASVAGAGFINITLNDKALIELIRKSVSHPLKNKTILVEFSDPNPFKILHAGHLYTSIIGESIALMIEAAGAKVVRLNYGGDVGLHSAKTIWAVINALGGGNPDKLDSLQTSERSAWLAERYVEGDKAYADESKKQEISEVNKRIYKLHNEGDKDSPFAKIYWTTRQWSYDYFEDFYEKIGIKFDRYYPESAVYKLGLQKVKQNTPNVYEESDGAIVFRGEKYDLHTRVFVTKAGLPTYEAKEVGLAFQKKADYDYDLSIIVTANEIIQYMQVVQKSIEQFAPELVETTKHLNHGIVKLPGGMKMSSRKGNILKAVDVLDLANKANQEKNNSSDTTISLGAVKYAFLKTKIGGDVVYDPDEAIKLEGNNGPYIQYALIRAKSILEKADATDSDITDLEPGERVLAQKISQFDEVYVQALSEMSPHLICNYLFELCQVFNRFYENNRVIGDDRSGARLRLVKYYEGVLESGVKLLGIQIPEKM